MQLLFLLLFAASSWSTPKVVPTGDVVPNVLGYIHVGTIRRTMHRRCPNVEFIQKLSGRTIWPICEATRWQRTKLTSFWRWWYTLLWSSPDCPPSPWVVWRLIQQPHRGCVVRPRKLSWRKNVQLNEQEEKIKRSRECLQRHKFVCSTAWNGNDTKQMRFVRAERHIFVVYVNINCCPHVVRGDWYSKSDTVPCHDDGNMTKSRGHGHFPE